MKTVLALAFLVAACGGTAATTAPTGAPATTQTSAAPATAAATTTPTTAPATAAPTAAPTTAPTVAPTPTPEPTPSPTSEFASFGDGTWEVGTDIEPGTYRLREAPSLCYWARLSGFGGGLDDIIANGNEGAPAIVTIAATDTGFESARCGTWTADLSQVTTSTTEFDEGTWIVGTDIEPGTYRSSGGELCYWARLSGFGGSTSDIVANDNVSGPTIVTIEGSDEGFASQRCGTWTAR